MWKVFITFPKKFLKNFLNDTLFFSTQLGLVYSKTRKQSTHNFLSPKNAKEIFFPRNFKYFGYKDAKKNIKCYYIYIFVTKKNYFKVKK